MLRPGVISFHLLFDNADKVKQWILLYDELWVPGIIHLEEADLTDEDPEHVASITWLAKQQFIKEPPATLRLSKLPPDAVTRTLKKLYKDSEKSLDKVFPTARAAALNGGAAIFNMDLALTRLICYALWRQRQESAFPVAFPFVRELAPESTISRSQQVLQFVIKRLPEPRPDLPLEELLAFRRDPETQYKFAKVWHWIQSVAAGTKSANEIEEELDWLLTDYRHQVEQISKRVRTDSLKAWVTVPANILENLVHLKFGKVAARLLDWKSVNIAAHAEELKAPGNEIAYLKEAGELVSPRR
jgi:hypothetical protein